MIKGVEEIRTKLQAKELKVTPQRLAILEAIYSLNNHPTAENIIEFIRNKHPNIAIGTVYKVLDTLVEKNLIRKVKSERDVMRYDGILEHHHHLYCTTCDVIQDYIDPELDKILEDYFRDKKIEDFTIEDIRLSIKGTFNHC